MRDPHGVDDEELGRRRGGRIVLARFVLALDRAIERQRQLFTRLREVAVVRRLAVRAPMPFVRVVREAQRVVRETKRAMSETKCVAGVIKPIV